MPSTLLCDAFWISQNHFSHSAYILVPGEDRQKTNDYIQCQVLMGAKKKNKAEKKIESHMWATFL